MGETAKKKRRRGRVRGAPNYPASGGQQKEAAEGCAGAFIRQSNILVFSATCEQVCQMSAVVVAQWKAHL